MAEAPGFRLLRRPPHPALRGLVRALFHYDERRAGPMHRREMPGPDAVLIFNLGNPIGVAWPDPNHEARIGTAGGFLVTPHPAPAMTRMDGAQRGVQAMLTPLGAERLLRTPLGTTPGALLPLDAALGGDGPRLAERLAATQDGAACLDLIEAELLRRLGEAPAPRDPVAQAWSLLEAHGGRIAIGRVAREVGWTRQTLVARFRQRTGLSPKTAARLLRFGGVVAQLGEAGRDGWADLAAAAGYADQSHLIRETKALTGLTPSALLARRLPDGAGFAA